MGSPFANDHGREGRRMTGLGLLDRIDRQRTNGVDAELVEVRAHAC
jgi:hypothetical protein